jgi:S1-C subfamily serine protease
VKGPVIFHSMLRLLGALALGSPLAAQSPGNLPPPSPGELEPERLPTRQRLQVLTMRRARLGVSVNLRARDTDTVGALLLSVTPGGPAAQSGLQTGDLIVRFNGQSLVTPAFTVGRDESGPGIRLVELVTTLDPGDTVALEYRRGTVRRQAQVIAGDEPTMAWGGPDGSGFAYGDSPEEVAEALRRMQEGMHRHEGRIDREGESLPRERFGVRTPPPMMLMLGGPLAELELAPLNRDLGRYFGTSEGVLVISVPDDSRLGLKGGDVVFAVDGRTVTGPAQLLRILRSYGAGENFRIDILRLKKKETVTGRLE